MKIKASVICMICIILHLGSISGALLAGIHGQFEYIEDRSNEIEIDKSTYINYRNYISECIHNKKYNAVDELGNNCLHLIAICAIKMPYSKISDYREVTEINEDDMDIVDLLIAKGVDVNAVNKRGWTPLMYAVSLEKFDIVKRLINNGCNVNYIYYRTAGKPKTSISALQLAVRINSNIGENHAIAELLLNNGAKVNLELAYLLAFDPRKYFMIKMLIDAGADPNKTLIKTSASELIKASHDDILGLLNSKNGKSKQCPFSSESIKNVIIHHAKFENAPLCETLRSVLREFNDYKITYENKKYENQIYNGIIDQMTIPDALSKILDSMGLTYSINDTTLLIHAAADPGFETRGIVKSPLGSDTSESTQDAGGQGVVEDGHEKTGPMEQK